MFTLAHSLHCGGFRDEINAVARQSFISIASQMTRFMMPQDCECVRRWNVNDSDVVKTVLIATKSEKCLLILGVVIKFRQLRNKLSNYREVYGVEVVKVWLLANKLLSKRC